MRRLLFLLVVGLAVTLVHRLVPHQYQLNVALEGDGPPDSGVLVYFSQDGANFYPQNLVGTTERLEGGRTTHLGVVLSRKPVKALRVDPVNRPGQFVWRALSLSCSGGESAAFPGDALLALTPEFVQLTLTSASETALDLIATGEDAQVKFNLPPSLSCARDASREAFRRQLFGVIAGLAAVAVLLEVTGFVLSRFLRRVWRWCSRVADWISDDATVVFSPGAIVVYLLLGTAFVVFVGARLHFSSIGVWDGYYNTAPVERTVNLGSPKEIRSDEWNVLTPWMLNQVQTGMQVDNPNIGAPGSTLLAGVPVGGPLMLAQPKYWGFLWLDLERGFSWYWAFKAFGLVAAVFTLLLAFTRGDVPLSLAGAIGLLGSSMVQWWFSGFAPEMIIGLCVAVLGVTYLLRARKVGGILSGALMVSLVVPNLLMHLYPPHLLPLAYLGVFLTVAILLDADTWNCLRQRFAMRLALMAFAVAMGGWLVWRWYEGSAAAIALMMQTEYPGSRFYRGGDMPWPMNFHGVFESWRLDLSALPFPPSNPTKASRLWVLAPLVALVVPIRQLFARSNRLSLALIAYGLLVLCWSSIALPEAVRMGLAHLGWSSSAPWESAFGMGVASALLVVIVASGIADGRLVKRGMPSWLVGLMALALVGALGWRLSAIDPVFFTIERIALAGGMVGLLFFAVHAGRRWLFLGLTALAALPTFAVNPVQDGLRPFLEKDIFDSARSVGKNGRWAVFGDMRVAQGFKAAGLQVINGTQYLPVASTLDVLDPQQGAKHVWNRYAHVELASAPRGAVPSFDLLFPDHYRISLDVCGPVLRQLGVTHVVYAYAPSPEEAACLEPVSIPVTSPALRFYRVRQR
ncbi:MAG: hypothetical protein KDF54_04205 [Hydrogenophaga sp.]|nr:hypothetical protein [Hydrogenophaga sp.]